MSYGPGVVLQKPSRCSAAVLLISLSRRCFGFLSFPFSSLVATLNSLRGFKLKKLMKKIMFFFEGTGIPRVIVGTRSNQRHVALHRCLVYKRGEDHAI